MPLEIVAIDVTGPHPRSNAGHMYLLTVQDHFPKSFEAYPIRNHTAITVARVLFQNFFSRYGLPMRLLMTEEQSSKVNYFKNCASVSKWTKSEQRVTKVEEMAYWNAAIEL